MKPQSDESLMSAYQKGDASAFGAIYARYSPNVMTFLKKRVALKQDQEEIFQRVFLKFHRNRHAYDPRYSVLQWLYVMTQSELLDFVKSSQSRTHREEHLKQASLSQNHPSVSLSSVEIDGMDKLDSTQREVVALRVLEEMSFSEIAQKLKKSEANVRQILSRTLRRLRNRKEDQCT